MVPQIYIHNPSKSKQPPSICGAITKHAAHQLLKNDNTIAQDLSVTLANNKESTEHTGLLIEWIQRM